VALGGRGNFVALLGKNSRRAGWNGMVHSRRRGSDSRISYDNANVAVAVSSTIVPKAPCALVGQRQAAGAHCRMRNRRDRPDAPPSRPHNVLSAARRPRKGMGGVLFLP
jgi:hypothetical protein